MILNGTMAACMAISYLSWMEGAASTLQNMLLPHASSPQLRGFLSEVEANRRRLDDLVADQLQNTTFLELRRHPKWHSECRSYFATRYDSSWEISCASVARNTQQARKTTAVPW